MKRTPLLLLAIATLGIAAAAYYTTQMRGPDMTGFAASNGRIEAESIDIATRISGRIAAIPVREGQMIEAGGVVAELELNDIAASLTGAQATVHARIQQRDEAQSLIAQAEATRELARKEFERAQTLIGNKAISQSRLDQADNELRQADAALAAARQRLNAAHDAIEVAQAEADRLTDLLKDQKLRASKTGRVLYKLAEAGEVVPAGGKIVTLLDLSDVYMSIFLPTADIGRLKMGDEARIVLDAMPDIAIPAFISYISPEAQFTPRQVETRTEREKLTFRVKVKIPPALLNRYIDEVKTGLPGMAYVRTDHTREWPSFLHVPASLQEETPAPDTMHTP